MAGYPGLGRVGDPATNAVCKVLFDLGGQLQRRITTLEKQALQLSTIAPTPLDVAGKRITDLANPSAGSDAVNLSYLRAYVGAQLAFGGGEGGTSSGAGASSSLGGSRTVGILAAVATDAINWIDVEVDGTAFAGWTLRARVEVRTSDVGTSVTPRVQNVTDATTAGTGVASTATATDYTGVNQIQTITVTLAAGVKKYRLQLTPSNANSDVYGIGYLELIKT